MSKEDRKQLKTLAEAYNKLPENKREYLIGYAEGVIAAHQEVSADESDGAGAVSQDSA